MCPPPIVGVCGRILQAPACSCAARPAIRATRAARTRRTQDRSVDLLHELGRVDTDANRPVRQSVLAFLLAVFRVDVHRRLAQARRRELERVEPELLDLALSLDVVGEEIAVDAKRIVRDFVTPAQERCEVPNHRGIRVDELDGVLVLRSLSPVQHATSDVQLGALRVSSSARLLEGAPSQQAALSVRPGYELTVHRWIPAPQPGALLGRELDVAGPVADR